jgi:hypothetical protein
MNPVRILFRTHNYVSSGYPEITESSASALMIDIFQRYTLKPTRLKCFGVDAICLRLFADDYL